MPQQALQIDLAPVIKNMFGGIGFIVAIVIGLLFIKMWLSKKKRQSLLKIGISDIDMLDGRTFEKYLHALFEQKGCTVELTKYIGDYGADLVLNDKGNKTVVQAKRWKGKVGVKAVQEAAAAKGYYGCHKAMVVTNSTYTAQAFELAKRNNVELWDRKRLIAELSNLNSSDMKTRPAPNLVAAPIISADTKSICAKCSKPVSDKVRTFCLSNAAKFNNKIYCVDCQKTVC